MILNTCDTLEEKLAFLGDTQAAGILKIIVDFVVDDFSKVVHSTKFVRFSFYPTAGHSLK